MSDFTGFYFGKKGDSLETGHSSYYNLVRVSGGDRYEEYLFPTFKDQTREVVGGDLMLYDSTNYQEKKFEIEMAFDNLKENDFRRMREWLNPKEVKFLRFDERPYKTYLAKLSSAPKLDFICFLEYNESRTRKERIYKGEIKLEFVAYSSMGICADNSTKITDMGLERVEDGDCYNWQELQTYASSLLYDTVDEWAGSSGLLDNLIGYNNFELKNNNRLVAKLYNPGDVAADFELYLPLSENVKNQEVQIYLYKRNIFENPNENERIDAFDLKIDELSSGDFLLINTKNHSLTTMKNTGGSTKEKSLRYDYVLSTHWIQIPQTLDLKEDEYITMEITSNSAIKEAAIKYSYKYY